MNIEHFHYPAAHSVILRSEALLLIRGQDAAKFLQGQVTCDVRDLANGSSRLGAQCTPKGRVVLSFRAFQLDQETLALRIPSSMVESALQSFGKYIVFSKAKLDTQPGLGLFGLYGEQASALASQFFSQLPTDNGAFIAEDGNYLVRLDNDRYECWISEGNRDTFLQQIKTLARDGNENHWQLLDIRAGIAIIYPETRELFTPQELNYQLVNAINFRKGCYTGQEIVARLHYRGKLKRHMYRVSCRQAELPPPGTVVINQANQQNLGHVVQSAWNINNQEAELLISIFDGHFDHLTLVSGTQKLEQLPLPYAIPTADEKDD